MGNFWIQDGAGRVLGPVSLAVLRDLISAGRMDRIERASRDGRDFGPLDRIPEVADLLALRARHEDQRIEAARIRDRIEMLRGRSAAEIFEIGPDEPLENYQEVFFRLVKQYHPDRLPPEALPDLRLAHNELFHFLAAAMVEVEREKTDEHDTAPGMGPPRPYTPREFVGMRPGHDGILEASVKVTPYSVAAMFTAHEMVNLARDGVFVPASALGTEPEVATVPMGTTVDLTMHFEAAEREVHVRGRVVWNARPSTGRWGSPGIGIKFLNLQDADRSFLVEYVASTARRT